VKMSVTVPGAASLQKKIQMIRCRAMGSAHFDVDALHASRLVSTQFPDVYTDNAKYVGVGWDNVAILFDGRVLFRFPRSRGSAGMIEREIAVLPLIAPLLPVDIPAPSYVGAASREYPWIFAGYDLLEGTTACSAQLSDEARSALAEPLARFLRVLHDIDTAPLLARGLAPNKMGPLSHKKHVRMTRERVASLARVEQTDQLQHFVAWLEAHPPVSLDVENRRLVHGDLYARHLLLGAKAHLTGVIDWGDAHLGDPAVDIAIAHLILPSTAHTAFRGTYGPVDDRTWAAARYRAIYHAIIELDYGIRQNDVGMRDAGLTALRLMEGSLT
jgi:aminoglycoside phosphotransferase (APT) family kinase protein